jgi:hypothetical protein
MAGIGTALDPAIFTFSVPDAFQSPPGQTAQIR